MTPLVVALLTAAPALVTASLSDPSFTSREAASAWCRVHLKQPHPATVGAYLGADPEARRRAASLLGKWPGRAETVSRLLGDGRAGTAGAIVVLYYPRPRVGIAESSGDSYRNYLAGYAGCDRSVPAPWMVRLASRPDVTATIGFLSRTLGWVTEDEAGWWEVNGPDDATVSGALYLLRHRATGRILPGDRFTSWGRRNDRVIYLAWNNEAQVKALGGGTAAVAGNSHFPQR